MLKRIKKTVSSFFFLFSRAANESSRIRRAAASLVFGPGEAAACERASEANATDIKFHSDLLRCGHGGD
ncbi:unnamed protein product [Lampetra fluviatilis]